MGTVRYMGQARRIKEQVNQPITHKQESSSSSTVTILVHKNRFHHANATVLLDIGYTAMQLSKIDSHRM